MWPDRPVGLVNRVHADLVSLAPGYQRLVHTPIPVPGVREVLALFEDDRVVLSCVVVDSSGSSRSMLRRPR